MLIKKKIIISILKCLALLALLYFLFSLSCIIYTLNNSLKISPELTHNLYKLHSFSKPPQTSLIKTFWYSKKSHQSIIAILSPNIPGEHNQAEMIKESAEKMGHLVYIYRTIDISKHPYLPTKYVDKILPAKYINNIIIYTLNKVFKPDFHLAVSFHFRLKIPSPKMMYISIPPQYYIDRVKNRYPPSKDENYFLDINLLNSNEDWLSPILGRKIMRHYGMVGVPANKYQSSKRQKLIFFGSLWGRKTPELYSAITKLAEQDYMFFLRNKFLLLEKKQNFSASAKSFANLQQLLNSYGIALCVHSKYHFQAKIPSSRIFEAISSGAIAISDKNPFVIKYFGNSVLYFDSTLSAKEIYKQIDNHVRWIQKHPKEAEIMAQKAHKILQDNFTTERFVQDMLEFYREKIALTNNH